MKPMTPITLCKLQCKLMKEALRVGRYPKPHIRSSYKYRNKGAAFQCLAYKRLVREINSLQEAIDTLLDVYAKNNNK